MPYSLCLTVLFFYTVLGTVFCAAERVRGRVPLFHSGMTLVAWPFFAPFILGQALTATPQASLAPPRPVAPTAATTPAVPDVARAHGRVVAAVGELDEMTREILSGPLEQVAHAVGWATSMQARAERLEQMTRSPEFDPAQVVELRDRLLSQGLAKDDPRLQSVVGRGRNIQQLHRMRAQALGEVERVVLGLDELASQVALMQFGEHGLLEEQPHFGELTLMIAQLCHEAEGTAFLESSPPL